MIVIPIRISHEFIVSHPQWIFVYGNDFAEKGCLGQPWAAGHEPNTFAVPTLLKICHSSTDRYFIDANFHNVKRMIDEKIAKIPRDGRPIICFPKIGEGCSKMKKIAPISWKYLKDQLKLIAYPDVDIDYSGKTFPVYG